jgi:hypothetical protein
MLSEGQLRESLGRRVFALVALRNRPQLPSFLCFQHTVASAQDGPCSCQYPRSAGCSSLWSLGSTGVLTAFLASLLPQLALHIPLSSIPLSQTTPTADQHESDPPKTAIQHLVEDAHSRDYDLVCVSLTNSSVFSLSRFTNASHTLVRSGPLTPFASRIIAGTGASDGRASVCERQTLLTTRRAGEGPRRTPNDGGWEEGSGGAR